MKYKIGDKYFYYIHRASNVYDIVYSYEDIDTHSYNVVNVFSLRNSTITGPANDLYYNLEDLRKQLVSWNETGLLISNSDFDTIDDYISHLRDGKLNKIGI